jgi:hypothetical protein
MASYSSVKQYQTLAADWTLGSATFPNGYPVIQVVVDRKQWDTVDEVQIIVSDSGAGSTLTTGGTAGQVTFTDSVAGTIAGLFPPWFQLPSASQNPLAPGRTSFVMATQPQKENPTQSTAVGNLQAAYNASTNKFTITAQAPAAASPAIDMNGAQSIY